MFDVDPELVGQEVAENLAGARLLRARRRSSPTRRSSSACSRSRPTSAQEVADRLVDAGVKIIFNYSEQLLQVPPEVTVHTSSPAVDLLYALYFYLT